MSHSHSRRPAGLGAALAVTGLAQSLATLAVFALPVLVAQAAPDFGVGVAMIGYQVGLVYVFAALTSARGGAVLRRVGPLRTTQLALVCAGCGAALLASASPWIAIIASALLGGAYGLTNPAASQLLGRLAPASRRNLVFAVKQMGVPLGVALGGLILPRVAEAAGWRVGLLGAGAVLVLLALAIQPLRAGWDAGHGAAAAALARFRLRDAPALRALAVTGGAYALVQIALGAHMVAMLVLDFGWDPVSAGLMVGLSQAVGAFSRIGWAVLADAWQGGLRVLVLIGLFATLFFALLPLAPGAATWKIVLLFVLLGATSTGWNGVLVAESVRLAPEGAQGAASGAVLSLTFTGAVIGPTALALLSTAMGGYTTAFALAGVLSLAGAGVAWWSRRFAPTGQAARPGG
ncbi:MFS transporter [Roseococcus microcysteis]|uniref:MFS transporter n=1 Tax=Roseococcus microcysteis TaxID=2771361 RepID=UPI00168B21BC|nr:MFS transporter [Roseococcus microcysteis]